MFSKIGQVIFDNEAVSKISDFKMGLEVEMDRADETGHLSVEPYPNTIGDEITNPWITNDFLEAMSEVVTPPANNAIDAVHYLYSINTALRTALSPGEILWPLSMPPIMPKVKDKSLIAHTTPKKQKYFETWLKKHSISEGAPCGTHVNLSISPHIIRIIHENFPNRFKSEQEVKNYLYMTIAQGFIRYRWLITYLFGASPIAEENYFDNENRPKHPVRSLRQSTSFGFGAKFFADYTNLDSYVDSMNEAVKNKTLLTTAEGQGPVRLRGDNDLDKMKQSGIQYIELRMLDLDPSSSIGIRTGTIRFLRLMATYFIMTPSLKPSEVVKTLNRANEMNDTVALEKPDECTYRTHATSLIRQLKFFVNSIQAGPEYQEIIQDMGLRVKYPQLTPSGQLQEKIKDNSLVEYAVKLGSDYQNGALQALRPFRGFEDNDQPSAEDLKEYLFGGSWEV
ncbi:glutamate--cysteine ligase [Lactobacillus sp. Sy-1]|uniref:glutamate--cysteine ligase n=1 Tax=Lactobacillus sp. Sy-1 TaxID=2109645 RepID=UPI001C5964BF|nr:glutamate--cysteine ligase [Lactobacillus sp. Sy-1]MBW1605031.1 glutamate--cysteine ligase [Lactobacillus sp. Sy-1]